jgi:putative endonuclease
LSALLAHTAHTMTLARQALGKLGEDLAVAELEHRGYAIAARRYRTRCGEIDIVAERCGVLVFVEVKARETAEFGSAAEAVTPRKQRQLTRMANDYLAREGGAGRACRFDVVTVMLDRPEPIVEVYENAFDAC